MSLTIIYINGRPECPECRDGIILKEYPIRTDPRRPARWVLVCPVCEIRIHPPRPGHHPRIPDPHTP